ncbi:MAG TPA: hypothetical protein V6D48_25455 [Oculatellaceae cyanobacterium]
MRHSPILATNLWHKEQVTQLKSGLVMGNGAWGMGHGAWVMGNG